MRDKINLETMLGAIADAAWAHRRSQVDAEIRAVREFFEAYPGDRSDRFQEIRRLRDALSWYADDLNCTDPETARRALGWPEGTSVVLRQTVAPNAAATNTQTLNVEVFGQKAAALRKASEAVGRAGRDFERVRKTTDVVSGPDKTTDTQLSKPD